MRKYDFISALAKETAAEVVKNREEWMKYLTTAARLYKYPFRKQLLIYAQRPDATACASIELWNERINVIKKEDFGARRIDTIKLSDAKTWLIKLQDDGRGYSSIHSIRGVVRPAFQMAVDDDVLMKNPFQFELAGVVVNDAVTREAITKDQMRRFLKFIHDDVVYCKYYEVIYILFHTGMRISKFCGLTMRDIDLEKRTINIDHQLQRTSKREYVIEPT